MIVGTPRGYDQKWNFAVEIDGLDVAWFETVSGLEFEIGVAEQHEGGSIVVASQEATKVKFTPVTLALGATGNRELYDWALEVANAAANAGAVSPDYKKSVSIVQKDRDGTEKRRYDLAEAFPTKYKSGEWDAKAEENVVEEMTLTYRYYERVDG